MNHEWKIGELAVCILDPCFPHESHPKVGYIYTVKHFMPPDKEIVGALWFHELRQKQPCPCGPKYDCDGVRGFPMRGFRPLDESDYKRIAEKHGEPVKGKEGVK